MGKKVIHNSDKLWDAKGVKKYQRQHLGLIEKDIIIAGVTVRMISSDGINWIRETVDAVRTNEEMPKPDMEYRTGIVELKTPTQKAGVLCYKRGGGFTKVQANAPTKGLIKQMIEKEEGRNLLGMKEEDAPRRIGVEGDFKKWSEKKLHLFVIEALEEVLVLLRRPHSI